MIFRFILVSPEDNQMAIFVFDFEFLQMINDYDTLLSIDMT